MQLPDVNVLVNAFRADQPDHGRYRGWLLDLLNGPSTFGMSQLVLCGFVRVVTNPRIYRAPAPPEVALDFVSAVISPPTCRLVRPGDRHLAIFLDLCRGLQLRGNDVADACHAALAIESGSEWVTADRGFGRFPGLRWRHPLDG